MQTRKRVDEEGPDKNEARDGNVDLMAGRTQGSQEMRMQWRGLPIPLYYFLCDFSFCCFLCLTFSVDSVSCFSDVLYFSAL